MIRMTVEIERVDTGGNEYSVGVRVSGVVPPGYVHEGEGATMIGVCMAINEYMHLRGALDFNCLKDLGLGLKEQSGA